MFDTKQISDLTAPALQRASWLLAMEPKQRIATQTAHWGLWLDKYAYPWAVRCDLGTELLEAQLENARAGGNKEVQKQLRRNLDAIPSGKTAALAVARELGNKANALKSAVDGSRRFIDQLSHQHGTRLRRIPLYNHSPLILHLGRASVLENVGLYCDRTTGLPIIPGTAIKGVLSTWATWEGNQNDDSSFPDAKDWHLRREQFSGSDAERIFGCDDQGGSERAGDVIFVGGYPKTTPVLDLDLVNPHHRADGSDLTRLTPSVFLTVKPGTQWDFVFFVRRGASDGDTLLVTTERWLRESLEHIGMGAKTAAGYGRFGKDAPQVAITTSGGKPVTKEAMERQSKDEELKTQAQAAMQSDFPNPQTFRARILDKLNPGALSQLEREIPVLQKPENAEWLQRLKDLLASKDCKDLRKRLRDKPWFPQDWLPAP